MTRPIILKKRADFLRAANGRRWSSSAMLVRIRQRGGASPAQDDAGANRANITNLTDSNSLERDAARFGITVTKKIGNAVVRNRIRRRFKEALRALGDAGLPGHDYVLIARSGAVKAPFQALRADIARAARLGEARRPADQAKNGH